ncbi:maltase 2 [Microplitis demolitor]|uniref:maltase 2 n=1 Tax=Microplitis demolitor TaxID=69319 RepID=UPI0004CD34E3|nr:maltase 2 [Microplitis demolitor]
MERGKLNLESAPEVNSTTNGSVATYKALPEDSLALGGNSKVKVELSSPSETPKAIMGKNDAELEVGDGADEKMLNEQSNDEPTKNTTEVIFISENGDAKIDMKQAKKAVAGLSKEELMMYADDPFWVKLRWVLFGAFWMLWVAMLVGAIAIIVLAPKCQAPTPKKWWEKSPIVQLEPADINGKSLDAIKNILDQLKAEHVHIVSLSSFLKGGPGATENFIDVDPQVGSVNNVKEIIDSAKTRDINVVLELDPNQSSMKHWWFEKSVNREEPYTDYYVWADGQLGADGVRKEPNNWRSVYSKRAWTWHEQRQQYYLHQFNETTPDLNFNNTKVINEFNDIFKFWLDLGIKGFRLGNTRYLTEDPGRHDEQGGSRVVVDPEDYEYYSHAHTKDRQDNIKIIKQWRDNINSNDTNKDTLFAMSDDIKYDILTIINEHQRLIDLPQNSQFLIDANANIDAKTLKTDISSWISSVNVSWPGWDVNGKTPLRKRMEPDVADSLITMSLLLPGTPILKLNDVLPAREYFGALVEKRYEDTFLYGNFTSHIINGTVFAYTRIKPGSPGYLVAYQSSDQNTEIDISEIESIPSELNVVGYSENYAENKTTVASMYFSNKIPMATKSTLVLTFVPVKKD